ncbi:hypothetical protein BH11CYA1_BH11CYA1_00400 [soil metagenome]
MSNLRNIGFSFAAGAATILLSSCSSFKDFDPASVIKTITALTTDTNTDELKGDVEIYDPTAADFARLNEKVLANPNNAAIFRNRGKAYYNSSLPDRYKLALADYNKALSLVPLSASWYSERANILSGAERYQEALKDINLAILLYGFEGRYYFDRASIYESLDKPNEALKDYFTAAEHEKPPGLYTINLAKALKRFGRLSESIELLTRVTVAERGYWATDAHEELLAILMSLGKIEEAEKNIDEWKSGMPDDTHALESSARMVEIFHPERSTKDIYNKLLTLSTTEIKKRETDSDPLYAIDYESRADYYEKLGQLKNAAADRSKAIELYELDKKREPGKDVDKLENQAELYDKLGAHEKALTVRELELKLIDARIKASPRDDDAFHSRGMLHIAQKNYQQALSDFEGALAIKPADNHYIGHHADCLNHLKRYQEAYDECQKGVKASARYREYTLGELTEASEHLGKHEEAISFANEKINSDRKSGDDFYWRGLAYQALGKKDLAKRDFLVSKWFKREDAE